MDFLQYSKNRPKFFLLELPNAFHFSDTLLHAKNITHSNN
jgi:hypothetical protein